MDMQPSQIDDLIRGEMAAVKTFDKALSNLKDQREISALTEMRQDHVRAVDTLKRYASVEDLKDTESSGAWGAFTTAITGGASLFGDKAALNALRMGEEHGVNEYREALNDDSIRSEIKDVIRNELLPQQERHLSTINSFIQ